MRVGFTINHSNVMPGKLEPLRDSSGSGSSNFFSFYFCESRVDDVNIFLPEASSPRVVPETLVLFFITVQSLRTKGRTPTPNKQRTRCVCVAGLVPQTTALRSLKSVKHLVGSSARLYHLVLSLCSPPPHTHLFSLALSLSNPPLPTPNSLSTCYFEPGIDCYF
jgi:hypothetical protein